VGLTTRTPIGEPLSHKSLVVAVATAVLPDGRPIAVTGSDDATVRIWDLAKSVQVGPPLHVNVVVQGIALGQVSGDVAAVIVGDGVVARVDLQVGAR
jgi:WD40 repeat protein